MSYNIKNELLIRKKLEQITPFNIEFNQNYSDKYGYDLECYKHVENNSTEGYEKKFMCFIEVEYGKTWIDFDLPVKWEVSFLQRKVREYNYDSKKYENKLKDNGNKTIYLKVNSDLTNCYFNKIDFIYRNGLQSKRNQGNRLDSFLVLERNQVNFGWEKLKNYIVNYCNN